MTEIAVKTVSVYVFRRSSSGPEFLALRRSPGLKLGETWQAVHGKPKAGEMAFEAARREMREESGLEAERLWSADYVEVFYDHTADRVTMAPAFAAEVSVTAIPVLSHEHTDFEWCSPEQMQHRLIWPVQREAIRRIMDVIITPLVPNPFLAINQPSD